MSNRWLDRAAVLEGNICSKELGSLFDTLRLYQHDSIEAGMTFDWYCLNATILIRQIAKNRNIPLLDIKLEAVKTTKGEDGICFKLIHDKTDNGYSGFYICRHDWE